MPLYKIANLRIDSALALSAVPAARTRAGAWKFTLARRRTSAGRVAWYHHEATADGRRWRSLAHDGRHHVIRFWRTASFVVSFAARRITCYPCASTAVDTIRQLLVGHVVPLVFSDQGALALHASAVHTRHGVLVFVGETGNGKTTLMSAFGDRGYRLVADDCAIVDVADGGCRVRPVDLGLRVWPDTVGMLQGAVSSAGRDTQTPRSKRRVPAAALGMKFHDRAEPLSRVYLLEPASAGARPVIESVPRADAVVALLVASFQLGMNDRARLRGSFDRLTSLAARVPVRRLSCPRGLHHVPAIVEAVLEDAAR